MSRILLVEDMSIYREPIAAALQYKGHEVECAVDGIDGCEKAFRGHPDLILMDLGMPRMDGLGMLKELRGSDALKKVPVIILTANSDRAAVVQAAQLGISGYMLKGSFSLQDMFAVIDRTLGANPGVMLGSAPQPLNAKAPPPVSEEKTVPAAGRLPSMGGGQEFAETEEPVDLVKSLRPIVSRDAVREAIDSCEQIHGFSPVVAMLLKITGNPNCSLDEVVGAASKDHAISLKLMRMANSTVYSRGESVDSLRTAVVRIGMKNIRQAVLNIGVVEHFSSSIYGELINVGMFWEHAIAAGLIAANIYLELNPKAANADAVFTMGLLHDVGRLVLMERMRESYEQVLGAAKKTGLPVEVVEKGMLLIDHSAVMDRVLHRWKFSSELINPIVFHHLSAGAVRQNSPRDAQMVSTLCLANRLAHAMLLGSSGNDVIYPIEDHCQLLNLKSESVLRIVSDVPEKVLDIKLAMLSQTAAAKWPQAKTICEKYATGALRPLVVGGMGAADPFNLLCQQIDGLSDDRPPNLAVVHLSHSREQSVLGNKLESLEAELGISAKLPLVVISSKGHLSLDKFTMNERVVKYLEAPIAVEKLFATMASVVSES